MVINTNISAQSSAQLLSQSSALLSQSLARLSSGSKITSPSDDPAGLAVSMKFDAQINRVNAAANNVANATSFEQTQDGFLGKVSDALNRMSELAVLSQDSTKSDSDRSLYNQEFTSLASYVTDLAGQSFNGVTLFDGTALAVTNDSEGNTFTMNGVDLSAASYTAATAATVDTVDNAKAALTSVKDAITKLASDRANIGANMSTLSLYSDQLGVLKDNLSAANSQIKDVDVAAESTNYARYNILVQAGTAMLAQANAEPQSVLRLLQ